MWCIKCGYGSEICKFQPSLPGPYFCPNCGTHGDHLKVKTRKKPLNGMPPKKAIKQTDEEALRDIESITGGSVASLDYTRYQ